jgi:hypothetical protein
MLGEIIWGIAPWRPHHGFCLIRNESRSWSGLPTAPINLLFSLEQPFPYEFNTTIHTIWVAAKGKFSKLFTTGLLTDSEGRSFLVTYINEVYIAPNWPLVRSF